MVVVLLQILLIPIFSAGVVFLMRKKLGGLAGWIPAFALLYTTFLVWRVGIDVYSGQDLHEKYLVISPGIRLNLLADGLSFPVLAIVILICTALAFYSIHYIKHRVEVLHAGKSEQIQNKYYARFFYIFPFFPAGFVGVILSTNLITLYFFMEVLTLTLFFLMAYFGYLERVRIAFISLAWGIIGSLLFLAAALILYSQIGSFEIVDLSHMAEHPLVVAVIVLFLVGFLMKLAIFPFHVWMPNVHAEHPTCIAGLLAIYANLGLYLIIRIIVLPLSDDFEKFGTPLMVLGLITMIYGALLALAQTDIKRLAACSTISQIAYSVFGLGALTSTSVQGSLLFFLSHIMGKAIFFSVAGIIVYATGIRDMRELGGLARKMPVTTILCLIGCMMLSGFPPFSSFTAEWIMFAGIFERGLSNGPLGIAIAIGGVAAIPLTVAYSFGAAKQIFFGPLNPNLENLNISDPPLIMTVPLLVLAAASVLLGLYPQPVMSLFNTAVGNL